jgi:hypothetical protein
MCVCVLGWHYLDDFYRRLYEVDIEKHIISHRPEGYLAGSELIELIGADLRVAPNEGLDWGGYYQFNEATELSKYDAVIYCHDDIVIKDNAFPQAVAGILRDERVMVVGNGNNGVDTEFRFSKHRADLRGEESDDFIVRTVRGSFFAARTRVFSLIGNFKVKWNASEKKMKKGNVSLRNFGYLVTKTFGRDAIAYLEPDSWLDTRYLTEMRRGEPVTSAKT